MDVNGYITNDDIPEIPGRDTKEEDELLKNLPCNEFMVCKD